MADVRPRSRHPVLGFEQVTAQRTPRYLVRDADEFAAAEASTSYTLPSTSRAFDRHAPGPSSAPDEVTAASGSQESLPGPATVESIADRKIAAAIQKKRDANKASYRANRVARLKKMAERYHSPAGQAWYQARIASGAKKRSNEKYRATEGGKAAHRRGNKKYKQKKRLEKLAKKDFEMGSKSDVSSSS